MSLTVLHEQQKSYLKINVLIKVINENKHKEKMMIVFDKIVETIYCYYPKNIPYSDYEYHLSTQITRLVSKRREHSENGSHSYQINEILSRIFDNYEVINWTDFGSSNGYEYRILLHQNQLILDDDILLINSLGGKRLDLFLFISILDNYYYFFVNETILDNHTNKWEFRDVSNYSTEIQNVIGEMQSVLSQNGYIEITSELANTIIEDVETELKGKGKARIFDCLFTDLIAIPS